jgi:hypothetical protein
MKPSTHTKQMQHLWQACPQGRRSTGDGDPRQLGWYRTGAGYTRNDSKEKDGAQEKCGAATRAGRRARDAPTLRVGKGGARRDSSSSRVKAKMQDDRRVARTQIWGHHSRRRARRQECINKARTERGERGVNPMLRSAPRRAIQRCSTRMHVFALQSVVPLRTTYAWQYKEKDRERKNTTSS